MVAELVDEDVLGERRVDGGRRLDVEDAAAAVTRVVDEDLDDVVRRRGGGLAERPVVVRQDVPLRAEDAVLDRERRPAEEPSRRGG